MLPAARVGDNHSCVKTPVGPIAPPGAPLVLIGCLPAARMGDMVSCSSPEFILSGEETVLIGGKPAARIGDLTGGPNMCPGYGPGSITTGCPNVFIGKNYYINDYVKAALEGVSFVHHPGSQHKGNSHSQAHNDMLCAADSNDSDSYGYSTSNELSIGSKKKYTDSEAQDEAKLSFSLSKQAEGDWRCYGSDDNNIKIGHYEGSVSHGYSYDLDTGAHEFSVVKLDGKVVAVQGNLHGEAFNNLVEANAQIEVLSAEGTFTPLSVVASDQGVEIKSKIGAEASLVEVSAGGNINITGKTIYDNTIGSLVGLVDSDSSWTEAPDWSDHGIIIGVDGEAGIGAAASAEAKAHAGQDGYYLEAEVKLGAGPMAGLKGKFGFK